LAEYGSSLDSEKMRQIGYAFSRFQSAYISAYVESHDSVMRSHEIQERSAEFLESERWWFYRNIADLVSRQGTAVRINELRTNLKRLDCSATTQELLKAEVRCACGYETPERQKWESIVDGIDAQLSGATDELLEELRQTLQPVSAETATLADSATEEALKKALLEVDVFIRSAAQPDQWSGDHARAFRLAHASIQKGQAKNTSGDELFLTEADIESAVMSLA